MAPGRRIDLYSGYSFSEERRFKRIREECEMDERIKKVTEKYGNIN